MTEKALKQLLLAYTQPAEGQQSSLKERVMARLSEEKKRPSGSVWRPLAAAAACVALIASLACFTPQGKALAAAVGESVQELWEYLFPPKDIEVKLEGTGETVHHTPQVGGSSSGSEEIAPSVEEEQTIPQFVIYVDEENYTTEEKDGVYRIYPIPYVYTREDAVRWLGARLDGLSEAEQEAMIQERLKTWEEEGSGLPVDCEIRITHRADVSLEAAMEGIRAELAESHSDVGEAELCDLGLHVSAQNGLEWDSLVTDVIVTEDGQGGVFVLKAQYFLEAVEGHGTRFAVMMNTFTVVTAE